jgi:hypothetical protein
MFRILEKFLQDPKQDPDPDTDPKSTEKNFCVCADGFQAVEKLFTALSNYIFFICFFEISNSF